MFYTVNCSYHGFEEILERVQEGLNKFGLNIEL